MPLTEQQKVMLLFMSGAGPQDLDPIRVMKGLFLISEETPQAWLPAEARYRFEPYDYGPCSFQVYKDLEALEHHGLVQATKVLGRTWSYHSLTGTGEGLAIELSSSVDPRASRYFATVRKFVTRLSFRKLLNAIYERYPDYAVNSVFR